MYMSYLPPHIEARRTMQWNTFDNKSWPGLSEGSIEASTSGVVSNFCIIKYLQRLDRIIRMTGHLRKKSDDSHSTYLSDVAGDYIELKLLGLFEHIKI